MPSSTCDGGKAAPRDTSFRPLSILVGLAYFMKHVAPLNLNLTMSIYLLCSLVFVPLSGLVAARYGTRTVFIWAVALFTASSVDCALVPSGHPGCLPRLAGRGRRHDGAGGAHGHRAHHQQGVAGRGTGLVHHASHAGTAAGRPALELPVLALSVPDQRACRPGRPVGHARRHAAAASPRADLKFDLREWLLAAGAPALLILLIEKARRGAGLSLLAGLSLALVLCVCLYVRRYRGLLAAPMLDFRLLRLPTFAAGFWSESLVRIGYGTLPFLLSLMLQLSLGYTALQSDIVLLITWMR